MYCLLHLSFMLDVRLALCMIYLLMCVWSIVAVWYMRSVEWAGLAGLAGLAWLGWLACMWVRWLGRAQLGVLEASMYSK